jgi:hypothetical protein
MVEVRYWAKPMGVLLALSFLGGGVCASAEESVGRPSGDLRAAAEARVAGTDLRRALSTQANGTSAVPSAKKPFFKTGRGITAAVLMVGGLSWLVYSHSHDRVRSPGNTGY